MLIIFLKILAGIIIVPFVSLLLDSIEEYTSGMASQKKVYFLQPVYDYMKLFSKKLVSTNKIQFIFAVSTLFFSLCASIMLFLTQNIIVVFVSLVFADLMLILGATSTNSPFSRMSAQRSIVRVFSYLPIILLVCVNIYMVNGSLLLKDFANKNLIAQMPFAYFAIIVVMLIKMNFLKFDFLLGEKKEKELSSGLYLEFSGVQLALMKLAKCYEKIVWLGVLSLFIFNPLWLGILISFIIYAVVVVLDILVPRYSWKHASTYSWVIGFGSIMVSILWFFIYK